MYILNTFSDSVCVPVLCVNWQADYISQLFCDIDVEAKVW